MNIFQSETSYRETAAFLKTKLSLSLPIQVGIVCGSGLASLASAIENPIQVSYNEIPHFSTPSVSGHPGKLIYGILGGKRTICMVGRFHPYEGHLLLSTVFPIRIMSLLGVNTVILTNAVGCLHKNFNVADIVVVEDHISLMSMSGSNPLVGPNLDVFGPRFPPTSDSYNYSLRKLAFEASKTCNIDPRVMREGVYCMVSGPSYESRAEARFLASIGGDVVGMSTIPEVIIARHCGMKVLVLSMVTNYVNVSKGLSAREVVFKNLLEDEGMHGNLVSHEEVLENSLKRAQDLQNLIQEIVKKMD